MGSRHAYHLKMFESYGYALSMIERPTGSLVPVDDIDRLLSEWGETNPHQDFIAISSLNQRLMLFSCAGHGRVG